MVDLPTIAGPAPTMTGEERRRAWLNMLLKDHGFLRELYVHKYQVTPDLWRSAQPGPKHLEQAKRDGFKTILNLRGARDDCGAYALEWEACSKLDLKLVNFPIRSRGALDKETLIAALDIWQTLEYPVLMHCKSGADRTGFMSTLYLWQVNGEPLEQAMRHLSLRYGHVRQAKTGVIDFFFEQFMELQKETGIDFREWIEGDYDKQAMNAAFKENWLAGIIVNKILRRE